ncbi:hypothetical protein LPJ64_003757 [Coemansia asiatica]|uniref:Fluoride ion transporter CrcB n=1 Tax=Coemansia asiatica TaxID=1052880 RepID=A0A9W8CIH9_9FUNG|nr:hypothetical protein LPJ64_003757 [Coemansia asiatica]
MSSNPAVSVNNNEFERDIRQHEYELDNSEAQEVPVEVAPESAQEEYEEQQSFADTQRQTHKTRPVFLFMGPLIASLVLFSMIGVLVRVHLTKLFTYADQPIYGLIWAQMLGCFIMGIAMRTKGVLMSLSPAVDVGITTGLCGSITTFSSWQLEIYQQFFNTRRANHTRFKNFLGGMSVLATTIACSTGALRLGQMIGDEVRLLCNYYLRRWMSEYDNPLSRIDTKMLGGKPVDARDSWLGWNKWHLVDSILVTAGILSLVAACLVVALALSTRSVSIALLLGPVGTLIRWRLASLNSVHPRLDRIFSKRIPALHLPFGTFIANVIGSVVLAIIHILQTGAVVRPSAASCYVLVAMADGFCGCLTTISTFAAELNVLRPRIAMLYAALSVVVAQTPFLLIAGIYFKTAFVDYPVC